MLIGNSITSGVNSSDGLGFRDELYSKLRTLKYPFGFVGFSSDFPYQGHFKEGAHIGEFYSGRVGGDGTFDVGGDMDQNQPHIVMIHLGTNDFYLGIPVTPYSYDGGLTFTGGTVSGRMACFIDYLLEWHNGIRGNHLRTIVVSQVIPNGQQMAKVNAFNGEIAQIVEDANNGQIPRIPPGVLRLADHCTGFNTSTMFSPDSIHPNDIGYQYMADIYYNTLRFLPMHLVRISDEQQDGLVGNVLVDPLCVQVTDDYGNGVFNVEVDFEVTEGDAVIISSPTVLTDATGFAESTVQLGDFGSSTIVAHSSGLIDSTVGFTVQAVGEVQVEGEITYESNGSPIPDVAIEWVEETVMVDTTDNEGHFYINNLPFGDDVTLRPRKERWSSLSGSEILSYDAALSARYVVGLENLSQQRRLAADVDQDGEVSMHDAAQIARYVVGFDLQPDIHIGEWIFYPDNLHYQPLSGNMSSQYFSGILAGDLHGGWNQSSLPKMDVEDQAFRMFFTCTESDLNTTVTVFMEGDGILSSDFVCDYDPHYLHLFKISKTENTDMFHLYYKNHMDGMVHAGLFGTKSLTGKMPILEFHFQMNQSGQNIPVLFKNIYVNDHPLNNALILLGGDDEWIASSRVNGSHQNFPNPFNEETVIRYEISRESGVNIIIYNSQGQKVTTLVNEQHPSGSYEVIWNGRDDMNRIVPSGLYFYRISSGEEIFVEKMLKVR